MASTTAVTSAIGHLLMEEGNLTISGGFDGGDQGTLWAIKGAWGIGWSTNQDDGTIRISVVSAETGLPLHDESDRAEAENIEQVNSALGSLLWRTRAAREAAETEDTARRVGARASRDELAAQDAALIG